MPGTSPQNPVLACCRPSRISQPNLVVGSIAIRAPLRDISVHVEQAPRIRLESSIRGGAFAVWSWFARSKRQVSTAISLTSITFVAKMKCRAGSSPASKFPFGLGRQAARQAHQVPQTLAKESGIVPLDLFHRQIAASKPA
jgi:hypothetical protein